MIIRITMRRHHIIWWVWQLTETYEADGKTYLIAQGAQMRKRKARDAADIWHNVYLRTRGLY